MAEGHWAWPPASRRAHYFVEGRSLCMRWLFFGSGGGHHQGVGDKPGPDDCVACFKRLKKSKAKGS